MDRFVHPCTKAPWLILVLAILEWFVPGLSIEVNAYQAEGGIDWPTWGLGFGLEVLAMLVWSWGWVLLYLPLILNVCIWGFAIYHGYLVMQKSK